MVVKKSITLLYGPLDGLVLHSYDSDQTSIVIPHIRFPQTGPIAQEHVYTYLRESVYKHQETRPLGHKYGKKAHHRNRPRVKRRDSVNGRGDTSGGMEDAGDKVRDQNDSEPTGT